MFKKHLIAVVFVALVFSSLSLAQIDKVAIFNESVGWTTVDVAAAATDIILANVTKANDVAVYDDAGMGTFAAANTDDGNVDIIVLFGYVPPSTYAPGNAEPDGSPLELFLEGGDIILNTSDYIFYVSSTNNDAAGLTNMTDSSLDCWTDGINNTPTADGATYTPSYAGHVGKRSLQIDQVEADADWELEVVFGSDGTNTADPAIIRNLTYGGRVGVVLQVDDDSMPKGEVISEIIENYIGGIITAVEPADKLAVTWGGIK